MPKRYVPFHKDRQQYAKIGGGLTYKIVEAPVVGHTNKERESWERLGYSLIEVFILTEAELAFYKNMKSEVNG